MTVILIVYKFLKIVDLEIKTFKKEIKTFAKNVIKCFNTGPITA